MHATIYRAEDGTDLDLDELTARVALAIDTRSTIATYAERSKLDRTITNGIAAMLARYHLTVDGTERAAAVTSYRTATVLLIAAAPEDAHPIVQTAAARGLRYRDVYLDARRDRFRAEPDHIETMRSALQKQHDRQPFRWHDTDELTQIARLDAYNDLRTAGQDTGRPESPDTRPPDPKGLTCLDMAVRVARDHLTTRADHRRIFARVPNGPEVLLGSICSTTNDPARYWVWIAEQRVNRAWCEIQAGAAGPMSFTEAIDHVITGYTAWRESSGFDLDEWGQYRQTPVLVAA